jgi:hypothetical protein
LNVGLYLAFVLVAVVLAGLAFLVWRLWEDYVNKSPADEELERDLVSLNDAQANRVSDTQLRRPVEPDDAWRTMVERGKAPTRRPKRRK